MLHVQPNGVEQPVPILATMNSKRIPVKRAPVNSDMVHVALASDANFLPFCAATISSVIANSKKSDRITFHVLCDAIPNADHFSKFQQITNSTNCTIKFIQASADTFSSLKTNTGISDATYYRLGITEILDDSVERIVYLDCDLTVLGRIKDLYSIDMEENALVGIEDGSSQRLMANLNQLKDTRHVNGGVLVLDLAKLRKMNFTEMVKDYVNPRTYTIVMGDQQILCGVLQGNIGYVGAEWNLHGSMHVPKWRHVNAGYSNSYTVQELEQAARAPKIIHYTSARKPWQKGSSHPNADVFMDYLRRSPYGLLYHEKVESNRVRTVENPSIRVIHDTIHNAYLMKAYQEGRIADRVTLPSLIEKHGTFASIATNCYPADLSGGNAENHKVLFKSNNILIPSHDADWEDSSFVALVRWRNSEPLQLRLLHHAVQRNKPVLFVETSFFAGYASWAERGLHPNLRRPLGFITDDLAFYFDATRPSRLELTLNDESYRLSNEETLRSRRLIKRISDGRYTKYNMLSDAGPEVIARDFEKNEDFVLVVDQGVGDASIELGLASKTSFERMLKAAISENPGKTVVVKIHPDTLAAGRNGNFAFASSLPNVIFLTQPVGPHAILDKVSKVYVVSSQLGFEALLRGKEVVCFGAPFYAGWGLSDDRVSIPRRTARRTLEEVFHAACIDFTTYIDPSTGGWCTMERCLDLIDELRNSPATDLAPPPIPRVDVNHALQSMWAHRVFMSIIRPFYGPEGSSKMNRDPEKFYESAKHPLVKKVGGRILSRAAVTARKVAENKSSLRTS
ncbi:hypothetical protein GOC21_22605 [Sinorhizobium meliloti]|nr:hypothetical protein [Sinorhizobium meliloti]